MSTNKTSFAGRYSCFVHAVGHSVRERVRNAPPNNERSDRRCRLASGVRKLQPLDLQCLTCVNGTTGAAVKATRL